jgi:hypothetical protein
VIFSEKAVVVVDVDVEGATRTCCSATYTVN